jgi:hypothetical protein
MRWWEVAFGVVVMSAAAGCASLVKKIQKYCFL